MKRTINVLLLMLLMGANVAWSMDDKTKLNELMKQDSADINTLASYPDSTRHYIFETATEPKGLEKLSDLQKKTNDDFKNLVTPYSKDDQQKIWNLTRYDNLINDLVNGGQKSNDQLEELLKNYPKDVHDDALNFGVNHYDLLVGINNVNVNFGNSYNDIIKDYPAEKQTAYNELIKSPEIISVMSGNINMTSELGDIYKNNPDLVKQQFDSLNKVLAQQKVQDTQAWKDSLQNNPQAMSELQAAGKDYAKSNGYNQDDYSTDPQAVASYHPMPYPYWAGYPGWYGPNYWYPNPYWYDCGFYNYGGAIVFIGVPTYNFTYWGFNHYPHYFYAYPNLSNLYFNRYYGARSATIYDANSAYNARVVNQWAVRNQGSLPNGFLAGDANRADRIRELGQAEMDRRQYNKANPAAKMNRQEYMNQHVSTYPHIQAAATNAPMQQRMSGTPAPAYQSPGKNGARQQQRYAQPRNNQPMQQQQMQQRPQSQQRSQPAQNRGYGNSHEEGGGRGK